MMTRFQGRKEDLSQTSITGKGRWGCVLPGGWAGTDSLTGFGAGAGALWTS